MANPITSALALPVTFGSSLSITVTDSGAGSPRTATFPAETYRQFLAYVGGAPAGVNSGTEADPHEWGQYLQYKLNNNGALALWTVTMTTVGQWAIAYGGTGTGEIKWDGAGGTSLIPRIMTGFTSNYAGGAGSITATHQPFAFAATDSRASATGRTFDPPKVAAARMPDGSVYGWSDGYTGSYQSFDLTWLPKDSATKSSSGSSATPAYPVSITRERTVLTVPTASYTLPYSWWEAITASLGVRCGFAQANLRELIAGSQTAFFDVYVDASTIQKAGALKPMVPSWDAWWRWDGITLTTRAQGTR